MRFYKLRFSIVLVFMIMFGAGCEKDEVLPASDNKAISEQTSKQSSPEEEDKSDKEDESLTEEKEKKDETNSNNSSETIEEKPDSDQEVATRSEEKSVTQDKSNTTSQKNNQATTQTSDQENSPTKATPAPAPETATKQESAAPPKETNSKDSSSTPTTETKKPVEQAEPELTVTISIIGDNQLGTILASTKVVINKGDTVLTATQKILKQKGVTISVRGNGASAYIEGIANLFEFDRGPLSGWTVTKNGILIDRSAGATEVKNGDQIRWVYTTDYEKDSGE